METAAYWAALGTIVAFPPGLLLWFVVHPFTRRWRRLGPARTYLIVLALLVPTSLVIFLLREPLLRVHFGVSWPLTALAVVLLAASMYVGVRRAWHLTPAIMFGLPQLSGHRGPGKLLTEGIYAQVRHPRYVEVGLGLASIALFSNYLAMYILLAAYVPVIYAVVLLEERELKERFGEEYERYCRDVPRFVPRLFGRKKGGQRRPREIKE